MLGSLIRPPFAASFSRAGSSVVEQGPFKPRVVGSIPTRPTDTTYRRAEWDALITDQSTASRIAAAMRDSSCPVLEQRVLPDVPPVF